MSLSKFNSKKRSTFNAFTRSFENSKNSEQLQTLPKDSEIKVLITRPNHRLGNQLLITPLIQEVKKQFPNSTIHLVLNGTLSSILFSNYSYVDKVFNLPKKPFKNIFNYLKQSVALLFKTYDIAIAGCESSNSSKIYVKLSRARFKIYNSGTTQVNKPGHIAQYPLYNFKTFLNPSEDLSVYDYPKLSIKLSDKEIEQGHLILRKLFNNDKKTICIFTFATRAKCHSKTWWSEFYERLKTEFGDFNILEMLPVENVSQIDFKSTHFYSKDLREIASIIENSVVFIGADSGMMHLAASTNTTTLGLFNVTKSSIYGPYGGQNQSIDTNTAEIRDILKIVNAIVHQTAFINSSKIQTS
ncbi:glycosyltransferase family 9 protein [Gelidibacter salicanalis]|uniref:Glycosyltransferase family 9 protein n=1 Tax=Gelidibacter salicanalis TaxID=291193 RepID=A0A934KVX2_9FLAO|nr:glycosyltransferase family 9 protein [Gelidibacter salicanalis]MBJ7881823.1 glycosyltransferase family 9 protein [Gelidibacter salicanalis]